MNKSVKENGVYLEIETNNGKVFIIDKEDYEKIKNYTWYACHKRKNSSPYIIADYMIDGKKYKLYLHRFLMGCVKGDGKIIDHINGDTLNNSKSNLRVASRAENQRNCKTQHNCQSGRKGVRKHKLCNKWQARITVNDKEIYLGLFDTFEEACKAREKAEDLYFKEYKSYEYR